MNNRILASNLARVEKSLGQRTPPAMVKIGQKADPFRILVGCLISARTRDEVTEAACSRLFQRIKTPRRTPEIDVPAAGKGDLSRWLSTGIKRKP